MSDDIPVYLMPVAAVLGSYALLGGLRVVSLIYKNLTKKDASAADAATAPPPSLSSRSFLLLLITVLASILAYGRVVASVNTALAASSRPVHFDPYELLQLPSGAKNMTEIKQAYRRLSKQYHPDKQQQQQSTNKESAEYMFHQIHLAYKALTDETAKRNYIQHGHPDGPLARPALDFALPEWLLHPQGNVALILVMLYLGMFVTLIVSVLRWAQRSETAASEAAQADTVEGKDVAYLVKHLSARSSHLDVLLAIATTPGNIRLSETALDKIEEIKTDRLKQEQQGQQKQKASEVTLDLNDLGDEGWADDDDEDARKAKEEEERKKKEKEQLAEAQGQKKVLLEELDEGVIGQKWVETTLSQARLWPPKNLSLLEGMKFDYKGKSVSAMEHPAVRRNLCMTFGRLNAILLNGHVDLLEAGSKGLVDQTYFKATQQYRQRVNALLENSLRLAIIVKNYTLAKTIIETICMFKIGVSSATEPKKIEWFTTVMKKQYDGDGGVPKLEISNLKIATPGEDEIATGDLCAVDMEIERPHAENITKKKLELCQKQGIPPQVALQTYRETWWVLMRAEKLDGASESDFPIDLRDLGKNPMLQDVDPGYLEQFAEITAGKQLLTAWPMVVQNVQQKKGKVQVKFKVPSTPGKYRFYVEIKSLDFLGADHTITQEKEVLDVADITREEDEDEEGGHTAADESKKDK